MFIAALLKTVKIWSQYRSPSSDEQIKKISIIIIIMEYYSDKKKNEILLFSVKFIKMQIIMVSEIIQTEKDKYHTLSLIGIVQSLKKNNGNVNISILGIDTSGRQEGGKRELRGVNMFKIHYRHIKIEKLKHVQIILRKTVRGSDREGEFNWGILYKYMELSQ